MLVAWLICNFEFISFYCHQIVTIANFAFHVPRMITKACDASRFSNSGGQVLTLSALSSKTFPLLGNDECEIAGLVGDYELKVGIQRPLITVSSPGDCRKPQLLGSAVPRTKGLRNVQLKRRRRSYVSHH